MKIPLMEKISIVHGTMMVQQEKQVIRPGDLGFDLFLRSFVCKFV
jgi:hypothetical protein